MIKHILVPGLLSFLMKRLLSSPDGVVFGLGLAMLIAPSGHRSTGTNNCKSKVKTHLCKLCVFRGGKIYTPFYQIENAPRASRMTKGERLETLFCLKYIPVNVS